MNPRFEISVYFEDGEWIVYSNDRWIIANPIEYKYFSSRKAAENYAKYLKSYNT